MEIQKEARNELMKRNEVSYIIEGEKTPSFSDIKQEISKKYSKSPDCIDVYNIKGKFGRTTFLIKAYVYDNPEMLVKVKDLTTTKKQKDAIKKALEDKKKAEDEAKKSEAAKSEEKPSEEA